MKCVFMSPCIYSALWVPGKKLSSYFIGRVFQCVSYPALASFAQLLIHWNFSFPYKLKISGFSLILHGLQIIVCSLLVIVLVILFLIQTAEFHFIVCPYLFSRDTGDPKCAFGSVLPYHSACHIKPQLETTYNADYIPPYPFTHRDKHYYEVRLSEASNVLRASSASSFLF